MFCHYSNTKRGVALLGVLLALLSSMEGSHLICQLGVCSVSSAEKACDQHGEAAAGTCSQSHGCATTSYTSASTQQVCDTKSHPVGCHQKGSCPCPPACWCQQAPQPLELPKDSGVTAEILLLSLSFSNTSVALGAGPAAKPGFYYLSDDSLHVTSTERCARLCRFLI